MNRNEIRKHTCIIIRRNGEYLLGKKWMAEDLLWTWSAYDAWRTRDREAAEAVARVLGGEMVLFNPIVNEKRVLGVRDAGEPGGDLSVVRRGEQEAGLPGLVL